MNTPNAGSWLDKLVGICLSLLVGAVAIYVAVQLIEAIATALVAIAAAVLFVAAAVLLLRARSQSRGW